MTKAEYKEHLEDMYKASMEVVDIISPNTIDILVDVMQLQLSILDRLYDIDKH